MFSNSGDDASSFFVQGESSSLCARVSFLWARLLTFSCRYTWELSTSKFEPELLQFLVVRPTLFLLSSFSGLTRDPDLCGETILFALTVHHQIGRSSFCHRRPITRGCVLSSFRHGTNHKALSSLREKTFEMAARTHRKAHDVEKKHRR